MIKTRESARKDLLKKVGSLRKMLMDEKRHNFTLERVAIIKAEIDKLLAASFIEEFSYS
ncbi:unnamed protein product [Prunus brigantina]